MERLLIISNATSYLMWGFLLSFLIQFDHKPHFVVTPKVVEMVVCVMSAQTPLGQTFFEVL